MKFDKSNILLGIIILLAAWNIFQGGKIRTDVKEYNKRIELIQQEIDSVNILNKELTEQIVNLDKEIDNIDGDINNVTKNITIIKKQTDEKIDSVNNFSFSDLEKFFAERYKNKY